MPISENVILGENVQIFHRDLVNLYGCTIGNGTKIGAFVEVQKNSVIGCSCKISSHSFICEGVTIEDEVFIGHGVMFTSTCIHVPPLRTDGFRMARTGRWFQPGSKRRAALGSNSTILAGITIGMNAQVGAGAVVTRDVPDNSRNPTGPACPHRSSEMSASVTLAIRAKKWMQHRGNQSAPGRKTHHVEDRYHWFWILGAEPRPQLRTTPVAGQNGGHQRPLARPAPTARRATPRSRRRQSTRRSSTTPRSTPSPSRPRIPTHFRAAMQVLEAVHVWLEKPIALNSSQAALLIEEAERRHLVIMVHYTFLYTSAVRRLRSLS